MFETLSNSIQNIFSKISGKGVITESNLQDAIRMLRFALLEADVNFDVVKIFINNVKEKSIGEKVLKSITPTQQFIKIVKDEIINILGKDNQSLKIGNKEKSIIMLFGLNGSGKTTTAAKLGFYLKNKGYRPILVPLDVYRPAAIEQLIKVSSQKNLNVFTEINEKTPQKIMEKAKIYAEENNCNIIIMDTAGRFHIDEEMMQELYDLKERFNPDESLLIVDSMTGQDAVNEATIFNEKLNYSGIILTKLDGDARGGAALSITFTTGKPIKFVGTGEKIEDFESFYPERIASRILGMGDIISLVEKAEKQFSIEEAKKLEKKLKNDQFTLNDFLYQIKQMKKMGPINQLLGMIPGLNAIGKKLPLDNAEKSMKRIEAIINSMTLEERENPFIIDGSRKRRIANGSGTNVQEVNQLLRQWESMRKLMKQLGKGQFKFPKALLDL